MSDSKAYSLQKLSEAYPANKGYILDIKFDSDLKDVSNSLFIVKTTYSSINGLHICVSEIEIVA